VSLDPASGSIRGESFWSLRVDPEARGVVVNNPKDACGVTHVSALTLGEPSAGETLALSSQLDLPEDAWRVMRTDGPRLLLERDANFALVELGTTGTLQLIGMKSIPEIAHPQLRVARLLGIGSTGTMTIEL